MRRIAIDSFKQENNFSLDANAGLTLVNWSEMAQASAGKGDVIIWTDTEGAFAGGTVAVSDINPDEDMNRSYSRSESPPAILEGEADAPKKNRLAQVLP